MTWTMTVADADQFFLPSNHIKAHTWRKYNATEKSGAFNQAVRELTASQGRALQDPSDATIPSTDTYNDWYAVCEQSLWILEQTPRQLAPGIDEVIDLAKDEEKSNVERKGILISPTAKMYLARSSIKMVRG